MNCQMAREAIDSRRSEVIGTEAQLHLSQCGECASYAGLLSLLQSHPRVDAPADFDFRLKARIARARDERHGVLERLAAFWQRGFSPLKAASALALIAVSIASATIYFTQPRVDRSQQLAMTATSPSPAPSVSLPLVQPPETLAETLAETPAAVSGSTQNAKVAGDVTQPIDRRRQPASVAAVMRPSSEQRVPVVYSKSDQTAAQEVLVYRPGQSRSIIVPRRGQALGAELADLQTVRSVKSANSASVEIF